MRSAGKIKPQIKVETKNIWFIKTLWKEWFNINDCACPNASSSASQSSRALTATAQSPFNFPPWTYFIKLFKTGHISKHCIPRLQTRRKDSVFHISYWNQFSATRRPSPELKPTAILHNKTNFLWCENLARSNKLAFIIITICWWLTWEAIKAAVTSEHTETAGYSDWCQSMQLSGIILFHWSNHLVN